MITSGYLGIIISFLGNLVLARVLIPENFGVYALAGSILSLVFMLAGFGSQEAIVQSRDESLTSFIPTAFWISIGIALITALLGNLIGLLLIRVYSEPMPAFILVLSWLQLFSSIGNTYGMILRREMEFKIIAILQFSGTLVSFVIAIIAAGLGAGAWALIIREAVATLIVTIGSILASRYSLVLAFNWPSARAIWVFGWRLMVTRISEVIFGRFDNFMVGTALGTTILGHYNLAYRLNLVGHQFTQSAIQPVVFSAFSAMQNAPKQLQYGFDRLLYWLCRATGLMCIAVLILGQDLVVLIYGEKWRLAGDIFQNMWLFFGIMPIHEAVRHVLMGAGYINKVVTSRIIMLAFFLPTLIIISIFGDILLVAWVVNFTLLLSTILMFYQVSHLVEVKWFYLLRNPFLGAMGATIAAYTFEQQFRGDISPLITLAALGSLILFTFCGIVLLLELSTLKSELNVIWSKLVQRDTNFA